MATDTLEIFGTEYSGVTGIKATDSNSGTKTYIRPQGTVTISVLGNTDVTAYATATVADANCIATNIKKDVSIMGVTGSYEGSGGTSYTLTITGQGYTDQCYVAYDGVNYIQPTTLTFDSGDTVTLRVRGGGGDTWLANVIENGIYIIHNQQSTYLATYNLPDADTEINLSYDAGTSTNTITITYTSDPTSLTLLSTNSLGTLSTSSTSATDTGKSITVTDSKYLKYDVLIVDVSVDSTTNGRHTSTVSMVYCTGTSDVATKGTYAVGSNKWNSKLSSSGTGTTRQSTTSYGIYANSASVSGTTMTIPFYYRYNSNNTGTINGTYTARVYGLKLYDLIGG